MTTRKGVAVLLSSSIALAVLTLLMLALFTGAAQAEPLAQATAEPQGPSEPVSGDGITPTLWTDNPDCGDVGVEYGESWYGFKVNKAPQGTFPFDRSNGGTHTGGTNEHLDDPSSSVTISNVVSSNGDQILFDWSASLGIDAVIVKYGDYANVYVYEPEDFADSNLGSDGVDPINGISHIEFCYDYEDECGDLKAFKYLDANKNGQHDAGEVGLEFWTINLYSGATGALVDTQDTDGDGYADFGCVEPGTYAVCEELETGWTSSDPPGDTLCKSVTVEGGQPQTVKFGNYQEEMGTKAGHKFHDLNGDGQQDDGELGLIDWEIHLFAERTVNGTPTYVATTDVNGNFATTVMPGCYTVCEVLKTNWTQSFPDGVPVVDSVVVDCTGYGADYGPRGYYECIAAGEVVSNNVFGNYTTAVKKGQKYHDLNANGNKDAGEPGLGGWTINLGGTDGAGNAVNRSTTTDANGYYSFTVPPGTYSVTEVCDPDWRQSEPGPRTDEAGCGNNAHDVTLQSMAIDIDNDFGNFQDALKTGKKFHDKDHSGDWTVGDEVIEGWTMYLDGIDSAGNAVHQETQTSASGVYSFTVPPGSYTVCEDLPSDWEQTFPAAGPVCSDYGGGFGYAVELSSGGEEYNNDFGNDPKLIVGGATVAPRDAQMLLVRLTIMCLATLIGCGAGLVLLRRKAT